MRQAVRARPHGGVRIRAMHPAAAPERAGSARQRRGGARPGREPPAQDALAVDDALENQPVAPGLDARHGVRDHVAVAPAPGRVVRLLAAHFLAGCATSYGRPALALTPAALAWLERQPFPGNVRQLKQTIERAVLLQASDQIDARELAALAELEGENREPGGSSGATVPHPGSMTLDQMERAMIANCLGHYGGNLTRVAEALGLSRAALYRRLEKYGLSAKD